MKIITFQDIISLGIAPTKCFEWAESMIKCKNQAMLPPKISLKPADGIFCNVMPSIILGLDYLTGTAWGGKGNNTLSKSRAWS